MNGFSKYPTLILQAVYDTTIEIEKLDAFKAYQAEYPTSDNEYEKPTSSSTVAQRTTSGVMTHACLDFKTKQYFNNLDQLNLADEKGEQDQEHPDIEIDNLLIGPLYRSNSLVLQHRPILKSKLTDVKSRNRESTSSKTSSSITCEDHDFEKSPISQKSGKMKKGLKDMNKKYEFCPSKPEIL